MKKSSNSPNLKSLFANIVETRERKALYDIFISDGIASTVDAEMNKLPCDLVDELVRLNEQFCVICNPNNSFVFNGVPTIVENWPLSPRRFKTYNEFKYLFGLHFIKTDDIILVPSGYFTEKNIYLL